MLIVICGKSGSGKSTVARAIVENRINAVHYDIDKIGHQSLEIKRVQEETVKFFGQEIITNGKIDRKKLGQLVFSSKQRMQALTDITWKYMQIKIDNIIQDNKDKVIILDWILLPLTPYFDMCDIKILVELPYEIRKKRAMQRDGITQEEYDLREKASIEYDSNKFDLVINNDDIEKIRNMVKKI